MQVSYGPRQNVGAFAHEVRIGLERPERVFRVAPDGTAEVVYPEPPTVTVGTAPAGGIEPALELPPEPREVVTGRRPPKRNRPTVAEFVHRHYDGPDPGALPRKRRRMRFPEQWRFHTEARCVRAAI